MTENEAPTGDELTDRQLLALPFIAPSNANLPEGARPDRANGNQPGAPRTVIPA